jgi:hypothetical protein
MVNGIDQYERNAQIQSSRNLSLPVKQQFNTSENAFRFRGWQ